MDTERERERQTDRDRERDKEREKAGGRVMKHNMTSTKWHYMCVSKASYLA